MRPVVGSLIRAANLYANVLQLDRPAELAECFRMLTDRSARLMNCPDYGLAVGCYADMVVLQAADPIEAVRLRAPRLAVIRRGEVLARTPARTTSLSLPGRPATLDPADYAPRA